SSVAAGAGDVAGLLASLDQPALLNLKTLVGAWQTHDPARWAARPEIYGRLAERLLKLGESLLAYDVASEGRKTQPRDLRLRQLQALALSRAGATRRANEALRALYDEGHRDEESLGLLARTHKDLWAQSADAAARADQLRLALRFYSEAYELSGGYWTGINAATLALLSGDTERAHALASEVREKCLADLARTEEAGGDPYWPLATLGEAALILGDRGEAEGWYERAAEAGRGRLGELASTRRNARLIVEHTGGDRALVERHLPAPRVAAFAGGDGEADDFDTSRFPPAIERAAREALVGRLRELNVGAGYAVAPAPGDRLFLDALLELGAEAHVVLSRQPAELPGAKDDKSGAAGDATQEVAGYEEILRRAASVVTASERGYDEEVAREYALLLLGGLARMRARQLDAETVSLALRDRHAAGEAGGRTTVEQGEESAGRVELIEVSSAGLPRLHTPRVQSSTDDDAAADPSQFRTRLVSMLFADALNFSKLSEEQIPLFVRHFLGAVGELVSRCDPSPLLRNTWGDGIYIVFAEVETAGRFALDLCERVNTTRWADMGLPSELNLRIALHAGPAYACTDPVTRSPNFIGTHVSRAARIEPITPPGQVYGSQAFAALAAAQGVTGFTCDYVGQTPLAKKYGTFPTYHVRRGR
ncbi:MAG TPA: adenylate/guanylate cyclase domain-containing protein, partial [Pyrinomonadaceae bacterium]|nr:adenylate/guanylate cyclase domain-containing protein [Pyrinomonadaceae bacterium]